MHEAAATPSWVLLAYLIAGVCFILALRGLSSPASSQRGNRFGMIGMAIAVGTTLAVHEIASIAEIIVAMVIGVVVAWGIAQYPYVLPQTLTIRSASAPPAALLAEIAVPHDGRLKKVMDALRAGATPQEVFDATYIDPWFVDQLMLVNEVAAEVTAAT